MVALGAILLLAFFLRVLRLDFQSLWYDEAYSVFYARAGVEAVLGQQQADPLPYYLLLAGWVRLAGAGEYAVRYLSVLLGTLTIPVVYQVVRAAGRATHATSWPRAQRRGSLTLALSRRGGRGDAWVRLGAAGAMAVSAFQVYYSQEARLHVLGGLMAAAIVYALVQAVRRDSPGRWVLYGLAAVAGMYSYYYLALLVAGLNLALLSSHLRSRGWWCANLAAAAATAPGFVLGYRKVSGFSESYLLTASPSPLDFLARTPSYLFLGPAASPAWTYVVSAVVLLLTVVGGVTVLARKGGRPALGLMLAAATAIAGLGVYALPAAAHLFFHPRYEIVVLPALLALLGLGWTRANPRLRWLWPASAAVVLIGTAMALFNGYAVPAYQRDDNRGALALVRSEALPDEVLVYDLPLQYDVLDYYGRNLGIPAQGLPLPKNPDLPRDRQFGPETGDRPATEARLAQLAGQYGGFWLLLSGDPAHWTEDWLDAHRLAISNQWFGGTRLKHYRPLPAEGPATLEGGRRAEKNFGPLLLRQVQPEAPVPGKPWPVRLAWQAATRPAANYTVSLQLFDLQGRRIAQHDGQPFDGALPTSAMAAG